MKGESRPEPSGNLGLVDLLNRNSELDLDPRFARRESMPNNQNGGTTPLELPLAWGFAGIPLLWGIHGTLVNAMKLFQ
jgi:hypothetical protein